MLESGFVLFGKILIRILMLVKKLASTVKMKKESIVKKCKRKLMLQMLN